MIVLFLSAGVWLIVNRFTAQGSGHAESVTVVEKDEGIDQFQISSPEPANGQDNSEPSSEDTSAESDLASSPEPANGQDNSEPSSEDTSAESDLIATQTSPQADLGLEEIVREFILTQWGGETLDAESDYVPSTDAKLKSTEPETRRRGEFEGAVWGHLWSRQVDDPYYALLYQSMFDTWWSCFEEYGVPPLEEFGQLTREQQVALEEELGLVGERMEQVQAECWSRARIYEGKDEETDRLLLLQHQYYLDVAQDWVEENPDSVVPVVQDGDAQENG